MRCRMQGAPAVSSQIQLRKAKERLEERGYRWVGNHSATRLCHWNRASIKAKGYCFKEKWYEGIESHRCLQMTPSALYCSQQCRFCWCLQPGDIAELGWQAFPFPFKKADDPKDIVEGCLEARRYLLQKAQDELAASTRRFQEAMNPTHFAICLSGEPTLYSDISELIEEIHRMGMTTHLVTNGTMPNRLESMNTLPSRLFVSLYAPDKRTYLEVCKPLVPDGWSKMNMTLQLLPTLSCPSTVELTLVKGLNMIKAEEYSKLIKLASPDTIHLKVAQRVGDSQKRIASEEVPAWNEVESFAEEISRATGYALSDQIVPYVILLAKN